MTRTEFGFATIGAVALGVLTGFTPAEARIRGAYAATPVEVAHAWAPRYGYYSPNYSYEGGYAYYDNYAPLRYEGYAPAYYGAYAYDYSPAEVAPYRWGDYATTAYYDDDRPNYYTYDESSVERPAFAYPHIRRHHYR
jgi:hypothetical protein